MSTLPLQIRPAGRNEISELRRMHAASLRALGRDHYDHATIDAFITHVGTLDPALIDDGTYFAAEIAGTIVASGGWSLREPGDAIASRVVPPPVPKVRSVFVHPLFVRQGIGRALMDHVEQAIRASGHDRASLAATLPGLPLYRALGYRGHTPLVLRLPGPTRFLALQLEKRLGAATHRAA